jgi:hypothetical protein
MNRNKESRVFSFVALLKAYSAPGNPLVCPMVAIGYEAACLLQGVAREDRQENHAVAGVRLLQLKEVLEMEQVERKLR